MPRFVRDPRFCDNVQRVANRPALDGIIAERFARRTREEVAALLGAADIAFGRLNDVADLAEHPQLRRITAVMGGAAIDLPAPPSGGAQHDVPNSTSTARPFAGNLPVNPPVSLRRSKRCALR